MKKIYKLHLECSKRRKFVKVRETRVVPRSQSWETGKLQEYQSWEYGF